MIISPRSASNEPASCTSAGARETRLARCSTSRSSRN
jgi:hypothetical protein